MKKIILSIAIASLSTLSYAEEEYQFEEPKLEVSSQSTNYNNYDYFQNNQQNQVVSTTTTEAGENVQIVEKKVPIYVTQKIIPVYSEAPHSVYEYVNQIANTNGYRVFWQNSFNNTTPLSNFDEFYQDKDVNWKSKIARAISDYNSTKMLSEDFGTSLKGFVCDNNTIVVDRAITSAKLYKTYGVSKCDIMINKEEIKSYMNGVEVKPEEIMVIDPNATQMQDQQNQYQQNNQY